MHVLMEQAKEYLRLLGIPVRDRQTFCNNSKKQVHCYARYTDDIHSNKATYIGVSPHIPFVIQ